ncbi:MAG TPA: DUF1538 domain-containing protein [Pirellulaceae bacterium]|nr:DUF1538 domain-containing protein [Pirellulaceae bacterium]HMO93376.1 DUF1538 domain-containing protein [Pirellulaceae bacterium]HMP70436.1 DUF1538 domain-containing protein [Pirellulaceae bacterium]
MKRKSFKWLKIVLKCCAALWSSLRDLLPIIVTIAVFQIFIFQQRINDLAEILLGLTMVVIGLSLFVAGLQMGLFPLGEQMARDFAKKGSVIWLVVFAFGLGFGTTFAEPALIAIAQRAADLASEEILASRGANEPPANSVDSSSTEKQEEFLKAFSNRYALVMRIVVGVSVGSALVLGVFRIIYGWPIQLLIMFGYLLVIILTPFAPTRIVGIAYAAGGVTTSTITVPLAAALGVGLANCIKGRNSLLDGFGLIAFASLTPIIFVLIMGIVWQ